MDTRSFAKDQHQQQQQIQIDQAQQRQRDKQQIASIILSSIQKLHSDIGNKVNEEIIMNILNTSKFKEETNWTREKMMEIIENVRYMISYRERPFTHHEEDKKELDYDKLVLERSQDYQQNYYNPSQTITNQPQLNPLPNQYPPTNNPQQAPQQVQQPMVQQPMVQQQQQQPVNDAPFEYKPLDLVSSQQPSQQLPRQLPQQQTKTEMLIVNSKFRDRTLHQNMNNFKILFGISDDEKLNYINHKFTNIVKVELVEAIIPKPQKPVDMIYIEIEEFGSNYITPNNIHNIFAKLTVPREYNDTLYYKDDINAKSFNLPFELLGLTISIKDIDNELIDIDNNTGNVIFVFKVTTNMASIGM
jgi:hypothetical protein